MLWALSFAFWRWLEIITLVPIIGMLGWFAHGYADMDTPPPASLLVLFVVSALALFWALVTIIVYGLIKHNASFTAFIDLCFVGTFIASVYEMRGIAKADCADFQHYVVSISFAHSSLAYSGNIEQNCDMLKASFALGVLNTIFFFFTSVRIGALPAFLGRLC